MITKRPINRGPSLVEAQRLASEAGCIINRRGSIRYWLARAAEAVAHRQSSEATEFCFRVIVPFTRGKSRKALSYPASGCQLYTRAEAVALLRRFFERSPVDRGDGGKLECYAEGPSERFTLFFPDVL